MAFTNAGIEHMGFKRLSDGEKVEAKFHSIQIYSVGEIRIDNFKTEFYSKLSHVDDNFSFIFGYNVNEMCRELINDDFTDDEEKWRKEKGDSSLLLMIHLKTKEMFVSTSGYWQRIEGKLLTYDCFPKANLKIKKLKENIVPPLISSLTIKLSEVGNPVRFKLLDDLVVGRTSENEFFNDIYFRTESNSFISKSVTPTEIEDKISQALKQYSRLVPKVASFFYTGLFEEDQLKKFLNLYMALEIHIHKTFSEIDSSKGLDEISYYPKRIEDSAKSFFMSRYKESKNLTQRFMWCAMLEWNELQESDIEYFKKIKKYRDRFMHGEQISESDLPISNLENLLLKII